MWRRWALANFGYQPGVLTLGVEGLQTAPTGHPVAFRRPFGRGEALVGDANVVVAHASQI